MAAVRKFAIRLQRFEKSAKRKARVGLVSQRTIKVNGKRVRPGSAAEAARLAEKKADGSKVAESINLKRRR